MRFTLPRRRRTLLLPFVDVENAPAVNGISSRRLSRSELSLRGIPSQCWAVSSGTHNNQGAWQLPKRSAADKITYSNSEGSSEAVFKTN